MEKLKIGYPIFLLLSISFNMCFGQNCEDTLDVSIHLNNKLIVSKGLIIDKRKVQIYVGKELKPVEYILKQQCSDSTLLNFVFKEDYSFPYFFSNNISYNVLIFKPKYRITSVRSIIGFFYFLNNKKYHNINIHAQNGVHSFRVYKIK